MIEPVVRSKHIYFRYKFIIHPYFHVFRKATPYNLHIRFVDISLKREDEVTAPYQGYVRYLLDRILWKESQLAHKKGHTDSGSDKDS